MFERYTENARRAMFFARYESSQFGAAEISVEHFLLGVLREDREFAARIPLAVVRQRIEKNIPLQPKISTSVDLPLSAAMKRVLAFSAEAAERLGQHSIGTQHHLLGILREPSFAADLLREYGFDETVVTAGARPIAPQVKAAVLEASVRDLQELMQVRGIPRAVIEHLVYCAMTFHHWLVKALAGSAGAFDLPSRRRMAEAYGTTPADTLFTLWTTTNQLLIHVLCEIPEGSADEIAPAAAAYAKHCGEVVVPRF